MSHCILCCYSSALTLAGAILLSQMKSCLETAVRLILVVSTATGLLSSTIPLTSQSMISSRSMDNKWRGAGPVTHDPPPAFVFDLGHLKHFLVVVETSLTTKQKALPIILCNCRHHFLKVTWINEVLTLRIITCLQGFILF